MSAVVFSNGIQRNKVSDMFQGLSSLHLAHSPAMEHSFQHLDDDVQGKRSSVQTWLGIPVSEGSTSSVDSMPSGDIVSPSDFGPSIFHNSGINAQVLSLDPPLLLSDDESGLDILPKKPMLGRSVLQESSDNLNTEEGLPVLNPMDDSCSKVKLMCSFGGKILPRPSDGKLRYVGGETRISCISRDITYAELLAKMRQYYDQAHTFKYQLPDEDLDALISVSTDEDLENMIEEYDRREAGDGSSKLRVFLFSASDDVGFNEPFVDGRNSEQRYVDAVNGVFEGMSRKQSVDNLVSLDALDTSCMPHAEEIPVGLSGPLHMHASTQAHLKPHSAPASAPNSPNLLPRSSHGRQPTGIDLHSPYTDQLSKVGSHQYSLLPTEAGLHDADHIATQVSNTSPYEFSYYMSEGRRPTDSSPSRQHDISLPPVHQDHHMRTEPQPRRMGETVIPRVGSHGKLSRLQEQHMDLPPNLLPDHRAEIQPFPDIILASDLHRFTVQQQQQQQFVPQPQLHAIDPQQDAYRRSELFHQPVDHSHHQLPMPSLHYHKGGHEGVYRQMEHHHLHQMQEDSFSGHYVHRPGTISTSAYPIGSTSLPAHVGYRDSSGRHIIHQQLSAHRMYNGASHVDLSFGRRPHVHTEQQNPSFRTPSSPPHYHDRHIDDRPAMQQQLLNVDAVIQDQGALLYDSAVATRPDILPRASLPQYANPVFQDMPVAYENQGGSEVRRQVAQHAIDNKVLTFGQGYHAASHHNARVECPEVQTAEHPPLHYRYHERIDMAFQQTDDARHSHYMVGRMHPAGNADYADVEFVGDRNVNYIPDVMATGLNNVQASEESNHVVGRPGDPYLLAQKRHDNVGATGNAWNSIQPPHAVVGQANKQVPLDGGLLPRPGGIVQTDMHFTEYVNDTQTSENLHVTHGIHNVSEETATELLYTSQLPSHISLDVHAIPSNGESPLGVETDRGKEVGVFCSHLQESYGDGLNFNEKSLSIKGLMVMDNEVSFSNQKESAKAFLNLVPESFDSLCTTDATQYEKTNTTMPVVSILEATPPVAMVASQLVPKSTDLSMPNNIPLLGSPTLTYEIATDESRVNGCEQKAQNEYDLSAQHLAEDVATSVLGSMVSNMTLCENVREAKPHEHDEVVDQLAQPLEATTVKVSANAISSHAYEQSFEEEVTAEIQTEGQELENAESISEVPENLGEPCQSKISSAEEEAIARGLQTIRNADLEEIKELGSGTFGTVYHGKWRGTDVAIKRIKASCFSGQPSERERLLADFWKEACTLSQLHHPNVVAFYGVVPDGPGGTLATVTEYMVNGSLKQVLQKKDRSIDRKKRLLIAMDAAFGMEYLHGKNIVHFDLKCENLLVNMRDAHRPICKVGDLGLSKIKRQTMVSGGVRGTLPWMAPELLNGSSGMVTEKVDVYSFGIVMWELLTGDEPYATMHYGAIIGGIVNNTLRPLVPDWCDPAWRALMERCWASDPGVRPSFAEIANELRAMTASLQPKPQAQA